MNHRLSPPNVKRDRLRSCRAFFRTQKSKILIFLRSSPKSNNNGGHKTKYSTTLVDLSKHEADQCALDFPAMLQAWNQNHNNYEVKQLPFTLIAL